MTTRRRVLPTGWYPAAAAGCTREIEDFLQGFTPPPGQWRGGVAPHAGWYFSGRAAAKVMTTLARAEQPERVVVYGGHLGGANEPIVYTEDAWETPLGALPMDAAFARELIAARHATAAPSSYADHTVEIQLPFVRHFFPKAALIAVHAPASDRAVELGNAVSELLEEKGLTTVCIGSADLTHYGPNYGFSPKGGGESAVSWVRSENDRSLIDKALAMDASGLLQDARQKQNSCSPGPIASVVASMARKGVKQGTLLEYYTSYDVMPNSSFVGYAAIVY